MARPYTPLSLGRRMRETHAKVMLSLLGGGVLLAGLMATDVHSVSFSAALAAWVQMLVLLAAIATIGWGARLLLQSSSGGAPVGRPLWVCGVVVLGGYTVIAALPGWLSEHNGKTMPWTEIAVNLLLSINLLIISIGAKSSAQASMLPSVNRSGSWQLRSNAGVLIMVVAAALTTAIIARGLDSWAWVRGFALPVWMLVCCAKAWLLTRKLVGRSSRWPVLSITAAVAVSALVTLFAHGSDWAALVEQAAWCYALSAMALVLLMASLRHTLVGWASAHPGRLQGAEWLEQAPIGMVRVDGTGTIVHANRTQLDWLGVNSLVGKSWTQALAPQLREQAIDWMERLRAGESLAFEQSFETGRGLRHLQTDILMAPQGYDEHAFMLLSHDVSMQKLMAGRVQEQQSQLVSLVSAIPDLVVLKGVDGRFLHCNQAFERLVGLTHAQIIGRTMAV